MIDAAGEDHFANGTGAALSLLLRWIALCIHCFHAFHQQIDITLWLVNRRAEELQATHVSGALDFHASLAALLHDLLEFLSRVLRWLRSISCGLLLLCSLLLLSLLDILLVQLHLLQGVGLCFHAFHTFDGLHLGHEIGLRSKARLLPVSEGSRAELRDDLEIMAATADHALDAGHTFDGAHVCEHVIQSCLGLIQRRLVTVFGPFEAPLTGDVLKLHRFRYLRHDSL
mmetsp:Transcript_92844/g.165082  ORF Transcript_92844/g.165082 Transcript_92844/m.165082 type:complete len:228 (+) Transcript_92844:475-1158(+)